MNWWGAVRPMTAGLGSLLVFVGGSWAALRLSITQFDFAIFGGAQLSLNPVLAYAGILVISAAVAFSLMLPALALGADWGRSLKATALAGLVFFVFIVVVIFPIPGKLAYALLVAVGSPGLISAVAIWEADGTVRLPVLAVAITAAVLYVASLLMLIFFSGPGTAVAGWIVTAASWPVLPAIAGMLRPG